MNKKFSTHWISSKRPGKQRKYAAQAPIHIKRKMLAAGLSKELKKTYGKRSVPLRKGDTVRVMVGKFKRKEGKVLAIFPMKNGVHIEGMQVKKQDGSKANVMIQTSNVQIITLNLEDSRRNSFFKKDGKQTRQSNAELKTDKKTGVKGDKNAP